MMRGRVNITLDVDNGGVKEKHELPFKILAMGNFSHLKLKPSVAELPRVSVNRNNLGAVMKSLGPKLTLEKLNVTLNFNAMSDFNPDNIALQVPELKKLIAMRALLKDLRSKLVDNPRLSNELSKEII